jgi:FkbM family methyltransferase
MQRLEEIYQIIYGNEGYNYGYLPKVKLCQDTDYIPKVENAGSVIDVDGEKCIIMHNGVLVYDGSYHGQWMTDVIQYLKGHHEPQEEKVFHEVLKLIPENSTMVECGSFWSYYSLWFHKEINGSKNYMIEPNPYKCELGQLNFKLNNFEGKFFNGCIGNTYQEKFQFTDWDGKNYDIEKISIDWLVKNQNIEKINILHADIQNAEHQLLDGAENSFRENKIDFLFLGTHSPNNQFIKKIESFGYKIICSFEVQESFFDDGLILACSESIYNNLDLNKFTVSKKK